MRDFNSLSVKQVRIYEPDRVPYGAVASGAGQKRLKDAFSFREVLHDQTLDEWAFRGGTAPLGDDGTFLVIEALHIAARRIVISVEGTTDQANHVASSVATVLEGLDTVGRWIEADPLVTTNETTCVLKLNIDWKSLFSGPLVESVSGAIDNLSGIQANAELKSFAAVFRIGYQIQDDRIKEYGITISDKVLVIEPRVNTPLSERLYFTTSPTDSAAHLQWLGAIEESLSKK